jgi:hypothetical protein
MSIKSTATYIGVCQTTQKDLPNKYLLALNRVELLLLLNSPKRGTKKNGSF